MATKSIEIVIGEKPAEPVDKTKVRKSEPAFPSLEPKVEAYHQHPQPHPLPLPWPPPGVTLTECPNCHELGKNLFQPGWVREFTTCWSCGFTYLVGR